MRPRVAVTLGDPRGIGSEIVRKMLQSPPEGADYVVIGPGELVSGLPAEQIVVGEPVVGSGASRDTLEVSAADAGRLTGLQVEEAVSLALSGSIQAVVTGPAEKRALHLAGYEYPGHTEWLGELSGGVETTMMLAAGGLRVVLVTTHLPLRDVVRAVTFDRVVCAGQLAVRALKEWWGIADPRIALCALNPHGGENGLFGSEELEVLTPAAKELRATGPLPADTVFVRALRGEFHAVLTPYHDVGMTAVKIVGFGKGVNVTLGLPFVRTAPDHGTAFDIAGQGIADPGSMNEAVALAAQLARNRAASTG
jgi:4-hydroxythreonine-4-phosphate dehydrogenase